MRVATLLRRSLRYYWRTHLAVGGGVAVAVAVLGGAFLVGASVRASLFEIVSARLGRTDFVVRAETPFRRELARAVAAEPSFAAAGLADAVAILATEGHLVHGRTARRAGRVDVYGVGPEFFAFHGVAAAAGPGARELWLTDALADELDLAEGDAVLLTVPKAGVRPAASLFGHKDDLPRAMRLAARRWPAALALREFGLVPRQQRARAVLVAADRLARELDIAGRANVLLVRRTPSAQAPAKDAAASLEAALRGAARAEDLGLRVRSLPRAGALVVESERLFLRDEEAAAALRAAEGLGWTTASILTYLANRLEAGARFVPYSVATGVDAATYGALAALGRARVSVEDGVLVNDWTARELGVGPGDPIEMEYYLWREEGRIDTERAGLRVEAVVPIRGLAADPELAPRYPGITDALHLADWEPPFPIRMDWIRAIDEAYWERYRTTPKVFLPLERAQALWPLREGRLSSVRVFPTEELEAALPRYRERLAAEIDPLAAGFVVDPVRARGLAAARGATDFGEYFAYFSFFLVVAALVLATLFFRFGVEQRHREIGILEAAGFDPPRLRRLYGLEGLVVAVGGGVAGIAGAVAYAALVVYGLTHWWVDAVGTTLLRVHVAPGPLLLGAGAGVVAAGASLGLSLRRLGRWTVRALITGASVEPRPGAGAARRALAASAVGGLFGLGAVLLAAMGAIGETAGFFAAGGLFLAALLLAEWAWLVGRGRRRIARTVVGLGVRNAGLRPGRSLAVSGLVALATFLIVSVGAFRREGTDAGDDPASGTGGFELVAESTVPIPWDPNDPEGRRELGLDDLAATWGESVRFVSFRLRPGDDASCLNLYRPTQPRVLGVPESFLAEGRFSFRDVVETSRPTEASPWLLLEEDLGDDVVPAIADATSMAYVLHRRVGDELALPVPGGRTVRLRFVASLADSVFQSEVLVSARHFARLFPDEDDGARIFLVDAPVERVRELTERLEARLADWGFDAVATEERLAELHRVENAYLATFQALGGLGLVLGAFGLAAILLRNVLERRRELGLLVAVGYDRWALGSLLVAEHVLLYAAGLAAGAAAAWIAIAPALAERGLAPALRPTAVLLGLVGAAGLAACWAGLLVVLRWRLVDALKTE